MSGIPAQRLTEGTTPDSNTAHMVDDAAREGEMPLDESADVIESSPLIEGNTVRTMGTETSKQREAELSCARLVREAQARMHVVKEERVGVEMGIGSPGDPEPSQLQTPPACGVIQATDQKQVSERVLAAAMRWEGGKARPFRALILGDGENSGGAGALVDEEVLNVVSLLVQLSSASASLDVTYLNSDELTLDEVRASTARCPNEVGVGGSHNQFHFVCSTLADFLRGDVKAPFDYVDVGRRFGRVSGDDRGGQSETRYAAEYADVLWHLIPRMHPDACMIV